MRNLRRSNLLRDMFTKRSVCWNGAQAMRWVGPQILPAPILWYRQMRGDVVGSRKGGIWTTLSDPFRGLS